MSERVAIVITHRRPDDTRHAVEVLRRVAADAGVRLRFAGDDPPDPGEDVELAVVLGGDGTILTALRRFSGTGVPVFSVNFGQVGFLASIEPDECEEGFARAFAGDFDVLHLPAVSVAAPGVRQAGLNDVSITRRPGGRVAVLSYLLAGEELGRVRCDGLVVATPAGSTGYNLANGGPVLAWGVQGYVVSFIAPHSLTARPLVVAPGDTLTVCNRSHEESVDVAIDGRPGGEPGPGDSLDCGFVPDSAMLAQVPGSTFYRRLRDKFGHLV